HAARDQREDLLPRQKAGEEEAPEDRARRRERAAAGFEEREEERDRKAAADESLQEALDEKRSADHALGRADEAHDLDLFAIEHHRQSNDVRDRERRRDREHTPGDEARDVD